MQLKILSKQTPLMIILAVFVFFLVFIFYFIPKSLVHNDSILITKNVLAVQKQEKVSFGLPMRLKIPTINVDTIIEHVGLTPQGAVGVPKIPSNVAWFNTGPRPGENGSAVITGHYGRWKNRKGSIFDNLYKLKKGDKLYVKDEKGITVTFVVREIKRYDSNAIVPEIFSSNDQKSHLNLITCDGVWNKILKIYSKRLVIFTNKE